VPKVSLEQFGLLGSRQDDQAFGPLPSPRKKPGEHNRVAETKPRQHDERFRRFTVPSRTWRIEHAFRDPIVKAAVRDRMQSPPDAPFPHSHVSSGDIEHSLRNPRLKGKRLIEGFQGSA
jgi:hypothetical protein